MGTAFIFLFCCRIRLVRLYTKLHTWKYRHVRAGLQSGGPLCKYYLAGFRLKKYLQKLLTLSVLKAVKCEQYFNCSRN
jgi:hypothetical protein